MSYMVLLITMVFNIVVYCIVYSYMRNNYKKKFRPKIGKLKYFPIVLLICWIFAVADYFTTILYKDEELLKTPHVLLATA